eukprot:IDg2898t1
MTGNLPDPVHVAAMQTHRYPEGVLDPNIVLNLVHVIHCIMRITDYNLGSSVRRAASARLRFAVALRSRASLKLKLRTLRRLQHANQDVLLLTDQFRFTRHELPTIMDIVGWSGGVTQRNRYTCDPMTATCIFLRRLTTPIRLCELEEEFGAHSSKISEIFWEVAKKFYKERSPLVTTLRMDLIRERAEEYAACIHRSGAPLDNCIGFIDGTKILIARPGGDNCNQRCVYSGHKRCHCLTYQTVTTPDGLIMHLHGPVEGRRSDAFIYNLSKLGIEMEEKFVMDGKQFCIYGDQAYVLRPWMQTAFPRHTASSSQRVYNALMNGARVSVEHSYGEVKKHFTAMDFKRKLKLGEAPQGILYVCSVLLLNFKTCMMHG